MEEPSSARSALWPSQECTTTDSRVTDAVRKPLPFTFLVVFRGGLGSFLLPLLYGQQLLLQLPRLLPELLAARGRERVGLDMGTSVMEDQKHGSSSKQRASQGKQHT